jgi:hypothetical protein
MIEIKCPACYKCQNVEQYDVGECTCGNEYIFEDRYTSDLSEYWTEVLWESEDYR